MQKPAPAALSNPARRGIQTCNIQHRNKPGPKTPRAGHVRSVILKEALNKSILDFSRPLIPNLPAAGRRDSTTSAACYRRCSTTYILYVDSSFRWNDNEELDADRQPCAVSTLAAPVIPAKAGIQWFNQDIPA